MKKNTPIYILKILSWFLVFGPSTVLPQPEKQEAKVLEGQQIRAIIEGMAAAEQRLKNRNHLRFFICVGDSNPTLLVKKALSSTYKSIHWCSEINALWPSKKYHKVVLRLEEPLRYPIERYSFSIESDLNKAVMHCVIPFDSGRPTTAKHCTDKKISR